MEVERALGTLDATHKVTTNVPKISLIGSRGQGSLLSEVEDRVLKKVFQDDQMFYTEDLRLNGGGGNAWWG